MEKAKYLLIAMLAIALCAGCTEECLSNESMSNVTFKGNVSKSITGAISLPVADSLYWDVIASCISGDGYGEGKHQATEPGVPCSVKCSYGEWKFRLEGRSHVGGELILAGETDVVINSKETAVSVPIESACNDTHGSICVNLSINYEGSGYTAQVKSDSYVLINKAVYDNADGLYEYEESVSVLAGEHDLTFLIYGPSNNIVESSTVRINVLSGLTTVISISNAKGDGSFTLEYEDYEAIL